MTFSLSFTAYSSNNNNEKSWFKHVIFIYNPTLKLDQTATTLACRPTVLQKLKLIRSFTKLHFEVVILLY